MTTETPEPAPAPRRRRRTAAPQPAVPTPIQPRQEAPTAGPSVHTRGASWFPSASFWNRVSLALAGWLCFTTISQRIEIRQLQQTGARVVQPAPQPGPGVSIPANETWAAIAQWVEAGQILDTDELVKVGRQLQKSGYLTDITRLDVYAKEKSKPITADNRAEVLRVVRG